MIKEKFSVTQLVNESGCFDLQFRKDTRHERTGSPTYYRWKIQFVVTLPKSEIKTLQKAGREIGCGMVTHSTSSGQGGQARLSVQNIDEIKDVVIPHFQKNPLAGEKKKDFQVWQKAAQIIYKNKGVSLSTWEKSDLHSLIELHKLSGKYKNKTRQGKWMSMAKSLTKHAQNVQ